MFSPLILLDDDEKALAESVELSAEHEASLYKQSSLKDLWMLKNLVEKAQGSFAEKAQG